MNTVRSEWSSLNLMSTRRFVSVHCCRCVCSQHAAVKAELDCAVQVDFDTGIVNTQQESAAVFDETASFTTASAALTQLGP